MSLYDDVYGITYKSATEHMSIIAQAISQHAGIGFSTMDELKEWAREYNLDKVVFSNMSHQFMCISHKGEIMLPSIFEQYYGNILFVQEQQGNRIIKTNWHPEGFEYYDKAYIVGERSDGIHKPLYYRDYCVPTGYYSVDKGAFNIAKPFPVFAAETGKDTSHIYTYIQHIAGPCAMWLLAWLRAKLLYPTTKTQVIPIIVSRAQGSGKTTFAEVICKGLFGKDNVIVSDQYDSQARFNADYADALIVCQEEKEETDKRNPAGALKSRATATTIRKEQKGVDPIYQESYTDFIMTTNKDVPIKFDGREDQRRFMIMEADEHFTRKESALADEVFTKLYGFDANLQKKGKSFVEDKELIAQFKHELFTRADIKEVELRNFPHTAAYERCFSLPRTTEAVEIETIIRSIAPFIREALLQKHVVTMVEDQKLSDVLQFPGAIQYMAAFRDTPAYVALCKPLVFYDNNSNKPYTHSVVERTLLDCAALLREEYSIKVIPETSPLPGGFTGVSGRYRVAQTSRFILLDGTAKSDAVYLQDISAHDTYHIAPPKRIGERLTVNKYFKPDPLGCFETVNEMQPGTVSLTDKTQHVQYMDTFLLESDTPSKVQKTQEEERARKQVEMFGEGSEIQATELYKERLATSLTESERLFNDGIVARIVYSGAKSYHLLIRVAEAPETLEEYKWLHAYLCNNLSDILVFDESTADPARLTRSPNKLERVSSAYGLLVQGIQDLVEEDWSHVYKFNWRPIYQQWLGRPLTKLEQKHGKPLYPTRKEYQEAAEAIAEHTFWSDSKFDGERQRLFFPAYRLLRILGFTTEQIWDELVAIGLKTYKKQNEVMYWTTRRNCALIKQIDAEIDTYEESFNGGE